MESVKFRIFERSEKMVVTPNLIIHSIIGFLLFLYFLSVTIFENEVFEQSILWMAFTVYAIGIIVMIINQFRRKPINGKLIDYIEFSKDKIVVSKMKYGMEDLKKIEVYGDDYVNKRGFSTRYDFNPRLSNGVGNWIKLKLLNGETKTIYFQLFYEKEIQRIKDFIIEYHHHSKVSFLRLIKYLNITDYNEIQKFKKELYSIHKED